jgi:anthranilate synthase/aminodeoxychorismate synthase-like glutamine amidotransferase
VARLVLIDNYDSFTWNLVQAFRMLEVEVVVITHDELDCEGIAELVPDLLVISPGPGTPANAGISCEAIATFAGYLPILGVCLGHQCLASVFGGSVEAAMSPRHGKTSTITHSGTGLFAGIPQSIEVMRYHSLIVRDLPAGFVISAQTSDAEIMALQHETLPIAGVQFHPESILTPEGPAMLANFVRWGSIA